MYKRKLNNYIIYPRFQLTLLAANIIILIFILTLIYFSANDVFNNLNQMGEKINLPLTHPYFEFVKRSRHIMNLKLNWAFGISILLTAISSIYISHKMVGPIYKLRNHLILINNNGPGHILKFRKGDFFEDLPAVVNKAFEIKRNNE